ncbi:MAG: [acyl-carrier-protein] S-malonyltransferase, partial [bacterium]
PVSQPEEIRQLLVQQLTSPVRWLEIVENMVRDGASQFYEIGPGSVLTGLLKRINKEVVGKAIGTKSDLDG